ncbi:hypothetical protein N8310_02235 [Pseudomonadota bacterium]|nr:hypothetical protein [Pseudomonadota bacterium]
MQRLLSPGEKCYKHIKKSNITVVIPSLGGSVLNKTLMFLNKGIVKPDLILICVPKGVWPKFSYSKKKTNVKIIQCPLRGQVKQKIFGFKHVKSKYTLQLDDDILVDKICLKALLYSAKTKSSKNAFGAVLRSKTNQISKFLSESILDKLTNFIIFGEKKLKMRSVLKTGVPTNIFDQKGLFLSKTEWLNGILFTNTKNLLKFDYYKLEGKAYNEDLIYSGILRKNSINLWVNNKAICFEQKDNIFYKNERHTYAYWIKIYRTRKIIISLYKGSFSRMVFFIFLQITKLFSLKLLSN